MELIFHNYGGPAVYALSEWPDHIFDEISPIQEIVWASFYCCNPFSGNGARPLNYSSCDSRLSKQTQLMNAAVYFFHSMTPLASTLLSRKVIFLGTNLPNALYRGKASTFYLVHGSINLLLEGSYPIAMIQAIRMYFHFEY